MLSALKPAEDGDGTVLRFFNPGDRDEQAILDLAEPFAEAHFCDLAERESGILAAASTHLELDVPAQKIVSVKVRFRRK